MHSIRGALHKIRGATNSPFDKLKILGFGGWIEKEKEREREEGKEGNGVGRIAMQLRCSHGTRWLKAWNVRG